MPYPQGVQAYWRSRWTLCTPLAGCGAHGEGSFLSKAWRAGSFWPTHCYAQWLTRRRCAKVLLGLSVNWCVAECSATWPLATWAACWWAVATQKGRPCARQQVAGLVAWVWVHGAVFAVFGILSKSTTFTLIPVCMTCLIHHFSLSQFNVSFFLASVGLRMSRNVSCPLCSPDSTLSSWFILLCLLLW